jgi:hypothetical protein
MPRDREPLDDEELRRQRRDSLMRRRLYDSLYDDEYERVVEEGRPRRRAEYADDELPPPRRRPSRVAPVERPVYVQSGSGGGCAQGVLYLVMGGLIAFIISLFVFGNAMNTVSSFFSERNPFALANAPTPTVQLSPAAVTMRIQQLNRLETTSYSIEKIIEVSVDGDYIIEGNPVETWLFGDRMLLIAHGNIVAGIDLSELNEEDVIIGSDGTSMTLRLPPARIFDVSLNNDETRVYDREQGLFAPSNIDLETIARQQGEQAILQTACEDGIMQRATEDGQQAMEQFMAVLDFEQVNVIPSESADCVPLPANTDPAGAPAP